MDTGNNTLSKEIKNALTLTDKQIEDHFNHMCKAGYDPLLCMDRSFRFIPPEGGMQVRHRTQFVDRIITIERYKDLLKSGGVKDATLLDDIIFLPINTIVPEQINPAMIGGIAAVFWLRPSGCRTLGQMYKKYEKKITDELRNKIITK